MNFLNKNMFIEDPKLKELVYSGNTVIFFLPNTEYETHHHKITPMSGNSKHSKNTLKIYVIIFMYTNSVPTL